MLLETKRCLVRRFCSGDAPALQEVLGDPEVMRFIEPAFTSEKTQDFIQETGLSSPPLTYALIYKPQDKLIGHVIFHPFDDMSYELGWILHKDFWGMGIADEVTKGLLKYAANAGIPECVIECSREQKASAHIALKNGFLFEKETDGLLTYRMKLQK